MATAEAAVPLPAPGGLSGLAWRRLRREKLAVGIAVYVETVFNLPGLGQMLIGGLRGEVGFDGPVIVAVVLVVGTAIIVLNLLADIAIALVDRTVERRGPQRARASAGVI